MAATSATSGHKKKHRFNKQRKAKKSRNEDGQKEVEAIIARCSELPKMKPSCFKRFTDLPLSARTLQGLEECDYEEPTDIQKESLPFSLNGLDVVGAAKTGSGKTLALIIPVLECLWKADWSNYLGLGALIISPTRELALQTFTVINNIGKHHEFSCALLIGGTDVDYERKRIGSVNIIICTPGRLLQHMDENEHLSCDQLQILVLDEADRILDMGFSQQDPVFVSAHERCAHATPDNLTQWYMVGEEQDKINTMWSFIVNHKKSKIIIFVSSCKQVNF
ncbi:DEAD/DEAH box helicase [Oesophagostomum dentatum]|uniref:ATP-dependent RNA helicase n=1 Tax=Oesophagostomum dentatum TaxID=61180 RepID=A0A0B1T2B8_OESDE|nr:DEAD/DEAH box helicase [Oesophagostomum dentatum]